MKKSSDTIGNRTRDLPVCSAVPQPLRHRAHLFSNELIYFLTSLLCGDIVSITDYTGRKFSIMKGQLIGKPMDGSGRCRF
jgi:hypothetical protein